MSRLKATNPTHKKGERLLAALRAGETVTSACQAEHIHRSTYYAWRAADSGFAAQADDAIESGTDVLEDEARRRAIAGSDTLLIFLLKARRPEKYRERYTPEGDAKPLEIVVTRRIVRPGDNG